MKNNLQKRIFTSKEKIFVSSNEVEKRIDNFFSKKFKGIPKSLIYRFLRKGLIRVNKKHVMHTYKLKMKDEIFIPSIFIHEKKNVKLNLSKIIAILNNKLYEDKDLLIINKPSGLAVHGGSGVNIGIIEGIRKLNQKNCFLELVHRLDKETSGILLIAKNIFTLRALNTQLFDKKVKKNYLGLVQGHWSFSRTVINKPLLKTIKNNQKTVHIHAGGKMSETYFYVKKRYQNCTLMNIIPITGRTHQIRVHASYVGHPIACDHRYGDLNFNKKISQFGLKRLFLHAIKISFIHPVMQKKITIKAPIESNLKTFLENLK